jgi:hypothetical protein
MENKNRPFEDSQTGSAQQSSDRTVPNPFENSQTVEKDIEQSQEEVDKEQQFKEALTERD